MHRGNLNIPALVLKNDRVIADSRDVAAAFGKQHKDVLKAIANLNCTPAFNERNFAPTFYRDSMNREKPFVEMTHDGFSRLVMGFNGEKAAIWIERYIEAFNAMEDELRHRAAPSPASRARHRCLPNL